MLEKFTTFQEYFKFLCNVDIAIFDYKHQSAFGNILLLLYLKKRIYLNPNGIMYKGLKSVGANIFTTDEVVNNEFKLITNKELLNNHKLATKILDFNNIKKQWIYLLNNCYGEI